MLDCVLKALRPELLAGERIDEAHVDAESLRRSLDAALDERVREKRAPNDLRRLPGSLEHVVRTHGSVRDHAQRVYTSEVRDQRRRHPFGECVLSGVTGEICEWQNC